MISLEATRRAYVRQRPADLVFSLYSGSFPADKDWVLAERHLTSGGWRLRAQIVGASHVAIIEREGVAITEVLVARPVHTRIGPALEALPGEPGGNAHRDFGNWSYTQELWCEDVDSRALEAREQNLTAKMSDYIRCAYPVEPGAPAGLTLLAWHIEGAGLLLETLHTYPDDAKAVSTLTVCQAGV